jgi:hypothetical protein
MAELEIMEALVSFLCPTSEAASSCREFIQNHSSVLPPIGPLFYFLLFPLIFTILFVYILSDTVLFGGRLKWAKVLIGVSAFIFIIISGLYPVALVLSEFWYILIVILGVWWFIKGHKKESAGGGGGGGKGAMSALRFGGAMGALMSKKQEHDELKLAQASLDLAENRLNAIKDGKEQRPSDAMQQIEDSLTSATSAINRLLTDPIHFESASKLEKRKNDLMKKLSNLRKK